MLLVYVLRQLNCSKLALHGRGKTETVSSRQNRTSGQYAHECKQLSARSRFFRVSIASADQATYRLTSCLRADQELHRNVFVYFADGRFGRPHSHSRLPELRLKCRYQAKSSAQWYRLWKVVSSNLQIVRVSPERTSLEHQVLIDILLKLAG